MAKKFLTDINIAGGVYDSSGDIGSSGQVLSSTGSGINWIDANSAASVVYQDGFTGNGSTTAFTLANSIDNENKTQVYIDGVYQHKDNYSLSGTTLTFSTAPPNSSDIEVISFSTVSSADDILYDTDFGSAGLMTTNGSGVYSITTNNSSNWNTAYTYSQVGHLPLAGGTLTGALSTGSNNINFDDGGRARFGNSSDMQIYHDGSNSIIEEQGDGNLYIRGANQVRLQGSNQSNILIGNQGGSVGIYHNNSAKIETASYGVQIINLSNTTAASETADKIKIGTFGSGRPAIFFDTSNTTYTNRTWFIENIGSAGKLRFGRNGKDIMEIFNDGNIYMSDKLGIGTTSPGTKLQVKDSQDSSFDSGISVIRSASSQTGYINMVGGAFNFNAPSGVPIKFRDGGTANVTINGSGSVGFGVTPFAHTLGTSVNLDLLGNGGIWGYAGATYVNSNAYYDSGWKYKSTNPAAVLQVGGSSPTLTFRHVGSGSAGAAITFSQPFTIDANGNMGLGVTSATARLDILTNSVTGDNSIDRHVRFRADNGEERFNFFVGRSGNSSNLKMYNSSEIVQIVLNTGDNSYILNNNFGIGTSSPSYKFTVEGSANDDWISRIYNTNTNGGGLLVRTDATSANDKIALGVYADSGYKMVVKSTGNVGIGTTSPARKLHINAGTDNEAVRIESTDTEVALELKDSTGTAVIRSRGDFRFDGSSGEIMRMEAGGNVGIGTTSPASKLVVRTSTDHNFEVEETGGELRLSALNDARSANIGLQFAASEFNFITGNVGIGTTSPSAKLEVRGTAPTYTNSSTVFWGGTTNNDSHNGIMLSSFGDALGGSLASNLLYSNSNTPTQTNTNRSSGQIKFGNTTVASKTSDINFGGYYKGTTTFVERMRINGDGNVGIGTTSPNAKLHVDGSVHFGPDSGVVNPSNSQLLIEAGAGNSTSLLMYTYGSSIFQIQSQGTQGTIGWGSSQARTVVFTNTGAGSIAVGINETAPAAKLQVSGDRDGNSEYVAVFGEDGGANGAANSANTTPVHKTLLTGYSIPYSGQTNARLTSVGFLEFDSTPGWTGNQRNWALTSGYDMGGTNGPKFAILMGDAQNVEPQLGTNGTTGSGTGDGANTRVAAYWKNSGDMVLPEGGLFVKGRITGDTNNANNDVSYLRTITIPYTGNSGSFTFDIDPVAEFGTRVSGGRLHLAVSGWQSRMNAGYIVYRNNGTGTGVIGTGNVTYYRYIWSETGGSQAEVAVSLISSSTNVIRISFSGWHTNDHGFEARLTGTS